MSELPPISLGVVIHNDAALVVERMEQELLQDGSQLKVVLPGGKIELGESSADTCTREVLEETGFFVRPVEEIYTGRHHLAPVIVSYWLCNYDPRVPRRSAIDKKIKFSSWVPLERLGNRLTSPLNPHVASRLGLE